MYKVNYLCAEFRTFQNLFPPLRVAVDTGSVHTHTSTHPLRAAFYESVLVFRP